MQLPISVHAVQFSSYPPIDPIVHHFGHTVRKRPNIANLHTFSFGAPAPDFHFSRLRWNLV